MFTCCVDSASSNQTKITLGWQIQILLFFKSRKLICEINKFVNLQKFIATKMSRFTVDSPTIAFTVKRRPSACSSVGGGAET